MQDAEKLFDDISKFVADSRAILAEGDVVQLMVALPAAEFSDLIPVAV